MKNIPIPSALISSAFEEILFFFTKKYLTKPPESEVASRPINQVIVRLATNLNYTLGGMSYESN